MENQELRTAGRAMAGWLVGLVVTAGGLVWLLHLDHELFTPGQENEYEPWLIAGVISLAVLFFAVLYTLMKATIQAVYAVAPPGRIKTYLAKQIELSGPLAGTADYWRRFANGSLILEVIKGLGAFVLSVVVIGLICAGLFGAWHVVASWPTWAIVIVALLVLNLGGKDSR